MYRLEFGEYGVGASKKGPCLECAATGLPLCDGVIGERHDRLNEFLNGEAAVEKALLRLLSLVSRRSRLGGAIV